MPDALARLQQRFADALLDPQHVPPDLFRPASDQARTANLLALYRGNLSANWSRALGAAFPVIQALLGEEFFHALARSYGRGLSYRNGDLNGLGRDFAAFIAEFGPLTDYPYMADMARVEWALQQAHYGPDAPALTAPALAAVAPDRLGDLRPGLHPNVRLLASEWAIGDIWFAHQPGSTRPLPATPEGPSRLVACRPRWRAELREPALGEFLALEALAAGSTLTEALERGFDADPDFDPGTALPRWLEDGLLTSPDTLAGARP